MTLLKFIERSEGRVPGVDKQLTSIPMVGNVFNTCFNEAGSDAFVRSKTHKRKQDLFCLACNTFWKLVLEMKTKNKKQKCLLIPSNPQ